MPDLARGPAQIFEMGIDDWNFETVHPEQYSLVGGSVVLPASHDGGIEHGRSQAMSVNEPILARLSGTSTLVDLSRLQNIKNHPAGIPIPESVLRQYGVLREAHESPPPAQLAPIPDPQPVAEAVPSAPAVAGPVQTQEIYVPAPLSAADFSAIGMAWLTETAKQPARKVLFDLGKRGVHRTYFHHVVFRPGGSILSLILDSRFPCAAFEPPRTEQGEFLQVTVYPTPEEAQDGGEPMLFHAKAEPLFNFSVGSLELTNLIVIPNGR